MNLIIDADSLTYHSKNCNSLEEAIEAMEFKIRKLIEKSGCHTCTLFVTVGRNFRYRIFPEYKANRIGKEKPQFTSLLKKHLIDNWGAQFDQEWEADDLVYDLYNEDRHNNRIASIDKDLLLNIPGEHLNVYTNSWVWTTEQEAYYNLHQQIIIGDPIDGIPSILKGLGKSKIALILKSTGMDIKELSQWLCYKYNLDWNLRMRLVKMGWECPEENDYCFIDNPAIEAIISPKKKTINYKKKLKGHIKTYNAGDIIEFGKYKGTTIGKLLTLDRSYYNWVIENTRDSDLKWAMESLIK